MCNEVKHLSLFYKNANSKIGFKSACKLCDLNIRRICEDVHVPTGMRHYEQLGCYRVQYKKIRKNFYYGKKCIKEEAEIKAIKLLVELIEKFPNKEIITEKMKEEVKEYVKQHKPVIKEVKKFTCSCGESICIYKKKQHLKTQKHKAFFDKIKNVRNYKCDCGSTLQRAGKDRHERSKKHQQWDKNTTPQLTASQAQSNKPPFAST
jgi:hypothetical protein